MSFRTNRRRGLTAGACLISFLPSLGASDLPVQQVERLITIDGGRPANGTLETVTWHRAQRFSGASLTLALLAGTYRIYAAGERQDDPITVEFMDRGTGRVAGPFSLGGGLPLKRALLTLDNAAICVITVRPAKAVHARRIKSYDIVIGLVRQ